MDVVALGTVAGGLWLLLSLGMAAAWSIERSTGNSGWIDVIWTSAMGGVGIAGATALSSLGGLSERQLLVSTMLLAWACRLAAHIALRSVRVSDDPRYRKLRDEWGASASTNMFWLLQAQAALSVPMLLAVVLAAWKPSPLLTVSDVLGIAVFLTGFAGSALADLQLTRFKRRLSSSGKVCNTALWSWSRHPNYFFEWLVWLGFAIIALDPTDVRAWGTLALVGPACMYWLLRYVSGVPPLEEHMLARYGDAYAAYQRSTSVFFPLPPRSS